MKRIFISMIFCLLAVVAMGQQPIASLKAEYEMKEHSKRIDESTGELQESEKIYTYVLQIAPQISYFYDPQQYFIDSILNDPKGKELYWQLTEMAMAEAKRNSGNYMELRDKMGYKWGKIYRCRKDFNTGEISVRDSNMGDKYRYKVDMSDLQWELQDSVKNILGYDCNLATADYHGRRWYAWFSPDIPVQDGPWQLYGLPGLIMEAFTDDYDYAFQIKGIQKCKERIKDSFKDENDFITNRKAFLKMKKNSRDHRAEHISAYTGGLVNPVGLRRWKYLIDFIETDYH